VSADFHLQPAIGTTNIDPAAEFITINVRLLSGPLPPIINMSTQATVRDLKLRMQILNSEFRISSQKLLIDDSDHADEAVPLLNNRTLQSYRITSSTSLILIIMARPQCTISVDDALKDSNRFDSLLLNQDMPSVSIKLESICNSRNSDRLLKLFVQNLTIHSIEICGRWFEDDLTFCEKIVSVRPDIVFSFVVRDTDQETLLQIVDFCTRSHCVVADARIEWQLH
jgi:hypothetical protein